MTEYVGIDWAYRRAAWCAKSAGGVISAEGFAPADEDGLARLVLQLGSDVKACLGDDEWRCLGARPATFGWQ